MTKYTIGEWGRYADWELPHILEQLQSEIETIQHWQKTRAKRAKKNYSRGERKIQIMRILADGRIQTTATIAKQLSMSPSGHLREILCELFKDGYIVGYAENTVAKHPVYYWYVQNTSPLQFLEVESVKPDDGVVDVAF